jgi:nicotinamide-nucleotide amidase
VHLRLTARAPSAAEAAALLAPLESALRMRLGEVVYGSDDETLETVVVTALIAQKKTLATAESCTGGLVAERITRVPNASRVFSEGFITYSNEAKRKYLMVDEQVLAQHGAVSGETARAMAHGARAASGADFAVSVTGIAGPDGGTAEKPVGTVHIGFAWEEGETSQEHHFLGSRADVRLRSSQAALNRVRLFLQEGIDEGAPAKNFS